MRSPENAGGRPSRRTASPVPASPVPASSVPASSVPASPAGQRATSKSRPDRPALRSDNAPPVLVKEPPPIPVRLCQLLWVLSFAVGGTAVVYYFIVRDQHLPAIAEAIRRVDASRPDAIYTSAADIVFWSAFALMVGLLLVQVTLLVAFMSRRPGTRWWQLATLMAQGACYALFLEVIGTGEHGEQLRRLFIGQCGLILLALLTGALRPALTWTARRYDIRRGGAGSGLPDL